MNPFEEQRLKKKKFINKLLYFIILGLFIASSMTLISSVYGFAISFHNLDLGQNIRFINAEYDLDLVDKASDFNYYSGEEMYIIGFNSLQENFFVGLISAFLSGYTFLFILLNYLRGISNNEFS